MSEHSRWDMCPKRIFYKYFCKIKFTSQNFQTDKFWTLSWPFSCDYSFWFRDLKFGMCIKDSINKTCWKNGKDLSTGLQKNAFSGFYQKFPQAMDEVDNFFYQFPNPWGLRVSGMGGYTSKCEKKSKSLHPNKQIWNDTTRGFLRIGVGWYSSDLWSLRQVPCILKDNSLQTIG